MSALERIQQEVEQWFLTEPLFFTVYCSHRLTINPNMLCALRSGQGRIEYNPELIAPMTDHQLRALLSVELIRILLKHPYSRQPLGCPGLVLKMASDMVIAPAYNLSWAGLTLPEDFDLPAGQHFEWYANRLSVMGLHMDGPAPNNGDSCTDGEKGEGNAVASQEPSEKQDEELTGGGSSTHAEQSEQGENAGGSSPGGESPTRNDENSAAIEGQQGATDGQEGTSGGGSSSSPESPQATLNSQLSTLNSAPSSDYTSLWEEDAFMGQQITDIIHSTTQWGSLPLGMVELIQKAAEGRIDYRNALRAFRSSILSQKRHLTRMYPSRRFGFEQMGSRYEFTTRLLVAIDTSGSVGSEELGRYYRIITTFFKYGIQEIDVLMFDDDVQGEPVTLKEAQKGKQTFEVKGRGGTSFQAPVNYVANHPDYDGLIIMTDGYAPVPSIPAHLKTKLLWVIDNEPSYKHHYDALRKTGRVCLIEL